MTTELQKLAKLIHSIQPGILTLLGDTTLRFINDNFNRQGFQGSSFIQWPARSKNTRNGGTKILSGKTGILMRSPKKIRHGNSITIIVDVPYAQIHNQGGTINRSNSNTTNRNKQGTGSSNIPQRRFTGKSPVLDKMCEKAVTKFLTQNLKQNGI